ncbi:hypothetical protein [Flammeovirga kamogawensis]|uniref:DUF1570 domain-containing protein n=1 Tax=Flammeovirga kamogawensis TaxID=373891 RepID=A0ABX8H2Q0_9BACT|nr:hypothetical protein [Flammeovirga kamogawensis]QWG09899.1 hypothetical protein KM029_19655 [Flammeovirga kamogawensis]TRX65403.1 hypothetical protein EO216_23050 [Flammeovirga kamogawensis]
MKLLQIIILLFLNFQAFGQKVTYNHIVDTADVETKKVMMLFENYLASNPHNKGKNEFWNIEEQQKHKNYDFLESEFQPSLYMGFPVHVLSVKFRNEICQIKAQFSYCKADGSPYVLAIANYIAKKEYRKFKLFNALTVNKQTWNCTTVGVVDFYYPTYHKFDYQKAQKLNNFISETCNNFGVKPKAFEYYLADDYDEIQVLKGLDYYIGMGGQSKPSGKATDDKVYCGGLGEYYPHEVFHVQIDEHFPNKHFWVSEGVATLLGGSRGKSLDWHIKRTNLYLQKHPEIDLNNMLKLTNLDGETSYHYVLGGLIAKKILDKGGWSLLKEFMSSGTTDEDYYNAIEKYLEINKTELNDFVREQLEIESKKITVANNVYKK